MGYTNKEDLYRNQTMRWRKRKEEAIAYMGGCCTKCGYNTHPAALHFHHIDPTTKEFNWTKMRLMSWDKIHKELSKCVLLCANCHSIEHSKSKYDQTS